ncbi:MAG TPA: hypothetical protein VG245_01145 [Candidatus Dormibacteraeota bacterium]|jgi:hypothetical protein|nr:hypothetical protein [Candidatus Dormibacteraeota bacterium]
MITAESISARARGLRRAGLSVAMVLATGLGLGSNVIAGHALDVNILIQTAATKVSGCDIYAYAQNDVALSKYHGDAWCDVPVRMDTHLQLCDEVLGDCSFAECHQATTTDCPSQGILIPAAITDREHLSYDATFTTMPGWGFTTYDSSYCWAGGNQLHCHLDEWFGIIAAGGRGSFAI